MLSMTPNGPMMGYGPSAASAYGDGGSLKYAATAAYSSQSVAYRNAGSVTEVYGPGRRQHGFESRSPMHPELGPLNSVKQPGPAYQFGNEWSQFGVAPPDGRFYGYDPEPEYEYYESYIETIIYYRLPNYNSSSVTSNVQDKLANDSPAIGYGVPTNALGARLGPVGSVGSSVPKGSASRAEGLQTAGGQPGSSAFSSSDSGKFVNLLSPTSITGVNNVFANSASHTADLLFAAPVPSREAISSNLLNAVARDVAFQEFLPTLFQPNTFNVEEHANVIANGQERIQLESTDGWIFSADQLKLVTGLEPVDAVSRECANTNEVLDELESVDRLMPAIVPNGSDPNADAVANRTIYMSQTGDVEGGMVLLRAAREVNISGLDLTPVYAEHVGRFNLSTKMETSVGMFQAMDVASDDMPFSETAQPPNTTQVSRDVRNDDGGTTKPEKSSASKAAKLIGAATLTGALVWANRNVAPRRTAQKRRAPRG